MSGETTPMNRRIYMGLTPAGAGMMRLRLSPKPLVYDPQQMAVLLSRGVLPADTGDGIIEVQLVTDAALAKGDTPTLSIAGVTTLAAGAQATAKITAAGAISFGIPAGAKGDTGPPGATLLGAVTITQSAGLTAALSAGIRIVQIAVPAAWGLKAGDPVIVLPDAHLTGYAAHHAVAVSPTRVDLAITAPLLARSARASPGPAGSSA